MTLPTSTSPAMAQNTVRRISRRYLLGGGAIVTGGAVWYLAREMASASTSQARAAAPPPPPADGLTSALRFMSAAQVEDVTAHRGRLDVTAACQRALDASNEVHFPAGRYLVDADPLNCLKIRSGQTVTLAEGAVLQAQANALSAYQVLSIENVRDVAVIGGTLVGERSSHLGDDGEHGMGIGVYNSANVLLRGVIIRDCWGDGIYVGGRGFEGRSTQVTIENCHCESNRRQGLTIAAVDGCRVTGGRFVGTQGIPPASGIDVEPNHGRLLGVSKPKAGVRRVSITDAECSGNEGHGITVSQVHTHDVEIRDLKAHANGMSGISCGYPGSDIRIIAPDCQHNRDHGIEIFGDPAYITRGFQIERPNCVANRRCGISVRRNVKGFSIEGGVVADNGEHGIACDGMGGSICGDGVIEGVSVRANSQAGTEEFDNIYIGPQCSRIRVSGNTIARGTGAHKPRYGINVAAGKEIVVTDNDLRSAGARANVSGLARAGVVWRQNQGVDGDKSPG